MQKMAGGAPNRPCIADEAVRAVLLSRARVLRLALYGSLAIRIGR